MKKYIPQVIAVTIICVLLLLGTAKLDKMEQINVVAEGGKVVSIDSSKDDDIEINNTEGSDSEDNNSSQEETTKAPVNLIKKLKKDGFTQLDAYKDIKSANEEEAFDYVISFTGDCLIATNEGQYYANCLSEVADREDPSYFFKKTSKYFKNDDFTIADCENVFSDSEDLEVRDKGQYSNPGIEAYWFKSKAANAKIFPAGGVEMVSISNNHIDDYQEQGHEDTRKALDDAGVLWGEEGKIIYHEKDGFKIGIICASMYGSYGVQPIKEAIEEASQKSDYQILYFHGGEEAVHVAEDWKIQACHDLVDAGADLIIGDHPHVLQPMEEYNGAVIVYSMGNFIFGGNRHPENRTIIYQHAITVKGGKMVSQSYKMIPCYVYVGDMNNWQPDVIKDEEQKKRVLSFMHGQIKSPF